MQKCSAQCYVFRGDAQRHNARIFEHNLSEPNGQLQVAQM